jgi:SAM-dependent methyltransferase
VSNYIYSKDVHNLKSPRQIVPLVLKTDSIKSVLDVGTGIGTWLKVFQEEGIVDVIGIDSESVAVDQLCISAENFLAINLSNEFNLNRKFDIAICLEVAEHLPQESADALVASLVKHSDLILFSAAIPNQGGQDHINEQWPIYWQEKFMKYGYYFEDDIRAKVWDNIEVDWWYKQNIFTIRKGNSQPLVPMLSLVHPDLFDLAIRIHIQFKTDLSKGRIGLRVVAIGFVKALTRKIRSLLRLGV